MQKLEVLFGKEYSGDKEVDEQIFWKPQIEHSPHLLLIGGSGSGKTETIKSIIFELNKQKVNTLIIDFHDDFKQLSDNLIDFEKTGATIHPLEIQANERPIDVAYRVSQMFKNIFHLGDIQQSIIRESIKGFYKKSGLNNLNEKTQKPIKLLPFSRYKEVIRETTSGSDVEKLISKISVIFDTPLFINADQTTIPFEDILKKTSVLKLNDYSTEEVKSLIAEIILRKLINHLYIKGQSDLELYCVIDEAHRLAYEDSPIDQMFRESRKYGLGLILASQSADDFSDKIRANTGAYLGFRANSDKDAVALSKIFQIDKSNFRNLLSKGLGYTLFSSTNRAKKLRITLVKDRPGFDKIEKNFDEDKNAEYFNASMKIRKREIEEQERIKRELEKFMKISKEQNIKLSLKENKIIDLTEQVSSLSGRIKEYTSDIANYKKQISQLSLQNENLENKVTNLKSELSDSVQNHKNALDKIKEYTSEIASNKKQLSQLSLQKESLDGQVTDLKSQLSDLIKDSKVISDKLKSAELKHKDLEDMKLKLESYENQLEELTNKLKNLKYLLNTENKSKTVIELAEEYGDFEKSKLKNKSYCKTCGVLLKSKEKFCECCGEEL